MRGSTSPRLAESDAAAVSDAVRDRLCVERAATSEAAAASDAVRTPATTRVAESEALEASEAERVMT